MAKVDHATGFYQKMAELQEKLKKSEEERLKLEEKFVVMMKTCREEEEKRIRALRERYEKFLEDDKKRRDRNERILQTLDRIDTRAAALSAKSERLKLLRKHYEAYLIRMYPLWKKQSTTGNEQSTPTPYSLHLPMDNEKILPWFGNSSGLYMTNLPLATTQSSLSPGSDQLWLSPGLPRNGIYVGTKQPIVDKAIERNSSLVESCSPAVEGALDNYIQRAAELLRVPVEELEGSSEKHDEEKTVHTEQDTSRDLLNVSLSDDSILQEKKVEDVTPDAVTDLKKEMVGKIMIKEEKHLSVEPDFQAGGDNMLAQLQVVQQSPKIGQYDIMNQPRALCNSIVQDQNPLTSEPKQTTLENVNMDDSPVNVLHVAYPEDNEAHQENIHMSSDNNVQHIMNEKIENVDFDNDRIKTNEVEEPHGILQADSISSDNVQLHHSYDKDVEIDSCIQPTNDGQPEFSEMDQELPENMDNVNCVVEQEAVEENLKYSEDIYQNDVDLPQEMSNVGQEYSENQEHTTQYLSEMEGVEEPIETTGETYRENDPNFENYGTELRPGEEYVPQNTGDLEQYAVNNSVQNYEQCNYDNTQQYEQEQYTGEEGQLYEQYPEQYNNEQYLDNTVQFAESQNVNDSEEYQEQYTVNENNYQEQYNIPDQQQSDQYGENVEEQYNTEENANQSQIYEERINNVPVEVEVGLQGITQPLSETEHQLENVDNVTAGLLTEDNNVRNEDCVEKEETNEQQELTKSVDTSRNLDVLDNQLGPTDVAEQEEENYVQESHVDKIEISETRPPNEEILTEQASATVANSFNTSTLEEDSEESSTGFWNPPRHSTIPSVNELAPKPAVVMEDTSESSADSKVDLAANKPPAQNIQQFQTLVGVQPDPVGDSSALSDQDEVEEQLAALVADPVSGGPVSSLSKPDLKENPVQVAETNNKNVNEEKTVSSEMLVSKPEKDSRLNKTASDSTKPSARTGLKKPPSLIKVLESDTESLNLDTGAASNVDSDEFDFSTE